MKNIHIFIQYENVRKNKIKNYFTIFSASELIIKLKKIKRSLTSPFFSLGGGGGVRYDYFASNLNEIAVKIPSISCKTHTTHHFNMWRNKN